MVKKGSGRELNPADAFRKSQRAKEVSRNKKERQFNREALSHTNDPALLREQLTEILAAEEAGSITAAQRLKKRSLQHAYDVALRAQVASASASGAAGRGRGLDELAGTGEARPPQDSVYYHPTLNPLGVPPKGKPQRYVDASRNAEEGVRALNIPVPAEESMGSLPDAVGPLSAYLPPPPPGPPPPGALPPPPGLPPGVLPPPPGLPPGVLPPPPTPPPVIPPPPPGPPPSILPPPPGPPPALAASGGSPAEGEDVQDSSTPGAPSSSEFAQVETNAPPASHPLPPPAAPPPALHPPPIAPPAVPPPPRNPLYSMPGSIARPAAVTPHTLRPPPPLAPPKQPPPPQPRPGIKREAVVSAKSTVVPLPRAYEDARVTAFVPHSLRAKPTPGGRGRGVGGAARGGGQAPSPASSSSQGFGLLPSLPLSAAAVRPAEAAAPVPQAKQPALDAKYEEFMASLEEMGAL